jgi:hypothetical protein
MALEDILFPVDSGACPVIFEVPISGLNAPDDIVFGKYYSDLLVNELLLNGTRENIVVIIT